MPSDRPSVKARPAYVEEANEEGERVRGTRRTASTKKKSDKGERSSRSSKEKKSRSDSGYSSHAFNAASDASSPSQRSAEVVREKETSKDERQSRRKSTTGSPTKTSRRSSKPPSAHGRNVGFDSLPSLDIPIRSKNDPTYFGVSPSSSTPVTAPAPRTTMLPNASRPARPQSYYGGMPMPMPTQDNRPPLARSAFYVAPSPVLPIPTSYPPASPSGSYMQYAAPGLSDSYFSAQPQSRARPLHERFISHDPIQRTTSASGIKELSQAYLNQTGYSDNPKSIRRRSKEMEDLRAMPPPPRPEIRRPTIRRVTTTDSRDMPGAYSAAAPFLDELEDDGRYERRMSRTMYAPEELPRRRSSTSRTRAYTYEPESTRVRIEAPNGRRRSYYEDVQVPRSSNYEDQVRNATGYQDEVAGGPPVNLTAEALRRAQRPTGSSRSTRSSGSKDESDWKRSATTRTTTSRSGQDGDDVTIRFKGGATVNIAGAEIKCDDGAEINVVRRKSIRNGSERSGSEFGTMADDRQSRATRPVTISRSTSKSGYSDPPYNPWSYSGRRGPLRGDI